MRNYLLTGLLVACFFLSCGGKDDLPDLPPEPRITFNSVEYVNEELTIGNVTVDSHSIEVSLDYEDGDEDLGFLLEENLSEVFQSQFIKESNGDFIKFGSRPGLPPFSCDDYRIWRNGFTNNIDSGDTVRIHRGLRAANFIFDWLVEEPGGSFVKFNAIESEFAHVIGCFRDFDMYITDVNEEVSPGAPFSITPRNRRQGSIEIRLISSGFPFIFRDKQVKIQLQVFDRQGNASNVIVSEPFTVAPG